MNLKQNIIVLVIIALMSAITIPDICYGWADKGINNTDDNATGDQNTKTPGKD